MKYPNLWHLTQNYIDLIEHLNLEQHYLINFEYNTYIKLDTTIIVNTCSKINQFFLFINKNRNEIITFLFLSK